MIGAFIKRLGWFILLLALQVLVFDHVHIMGYATPFVAVYFIILFPSDFPRSAALLWSFAFGFIADIFTNTPGVAAASLTATAPCPGPPRHDTAVAAEDKLRHRGRGDHNTLGTENRLERIHALRHSLRSSKRNTFLRPRSILVLQLAGPAYKHRRQLGTHYPNHSRNRKLKDKRKENN